MIILIYDLHNIRQGLVELADLRRDAEVDCAVADLNDETADDVTVDLCERDVSDSFPF